MGLVKCTSGFSYAPSAGAVRTVATGELLDESDPAVVARRSLFVPTASEQLTSFAELASDVATGLAVDPAFTSAFARVFDVAGYGAECDGQVGYYGQATSGSATLTDSTAAFTSTLVGKTFTMPGAGSAGGVWTGTITAVPSATTLTISTTAGTTSTTTGTGGAMTSGSNVLTDSGATFTHAMNGATVTVAGAGAAGATLTGQMLCPTVAGTGIYILSSIGNQNNAQNASTTVSSAAWTLNRGMYTIATDDTAAWVAALAAAYAAAQTSSAAAVTWSGISGVSSELTVMGGVHLVGAGCDPAQMGTAYPVAGSILLAHGAFSGQAVLRLGQYSQYREDSLGGGLANCTVEAARVAAYAIRTSGNYYTMDRVVARCGTTAAVLLAGWQTMMRDCTFGQPGVGSCLQVNEADAQMIGGYLKSGAILLELLDSANDLCLTAVHTFNSWPAAVGGTNKTVYAVGDFTRVTLVGCYIDNTYGPHIKLAPANNKTQAEFEILGCKFFQAGTPWYTFPDNTYPIVDLDVTGGSGAVIERVIISGCSGSAVWSGARYSAITAFGSGAGTIRGVTVADTEVSHCAAMYTGNSPSQISFSHVKAYDTSAGVWRTSPWPLGTTGAGGNPKTGTGTGSQTAFTAAHSMAGTPKRVSVVPQTAAAAALFYVTADTTNVTITYAVAPSNGASLAWWITAEL